MNQREESGKALELSLKTMDRNQDSLKQEWLQGPFIASVVYQGLNCTPEHRQAVQEAYNSLPALVRAAFERTGFHIEAVGTSLDMATRLSCPPPEFALGVTNYEDKLILVAQWTVGPLDDAVAVGRADARSGLNTTLAHEIGHVFDGSSQRASKSEGFIEALAKDITATLDADKIKAALTGKLGELKSDPRVLTVAAIGFKPHEAFAESFAFAIGYGGAARGAEFARCFPHCIEYARHWFERNYDNMQKAVAA